MIIIAKIKVTHSVKIKLTHARVSKKAFEHPSLRAGGKSTIVTTNLAFNRWDEIIQDKVLVSAMVDRITHRAYLINMTGKSYRLKETEKINSAYKELIKIN